MQLGVLDAGVVLGWLQRRPRGLARIVKLVEDCRAGRAELVLSTVNLAEVLKHFEKYAARSGIDVGVTIEAVKIRLHSPDAGIARRVAQLPTSLGDGFAAATALELGARLHTTDAELVRQLRHLRLPVTHY